MADAAPRRPCTVLLVCLAAAAFATFAASGLYLSEAGAVSVPAERYGTMTGREEAEASRRRPALRIGVRRLPPGVTAVRFRRLVRRAARRWSIRVAGATRRSPGRADGHGVIGFSAGASSEAAGNTITWTTTVGRRVLRRESDVAIDPGITWTQGPAYPTLDEWDLESVILHELGHVAGIGHRARCSDSPMASGIANGEWWRRPGDWFRHGCTNAPGEPVG